VLPCGSSNVELGEPLRLRRVAVENWLASDALMLIVWMLLLVTITGGSLILDEWFLYTNGIRDVAIVDVDLQLFNERATELDSLQSFMVCRRMGGYQGGG
jgi:hypothetical protein